MKGRATGLLERTVRLDFLEGVGVALGQRSVGFVHLVKRLATVTLARARETPLPPPEEPERRRSALVEAARAFREEAPAAAERCFASLPRGAAFVSRLSLPPAARGDLAHVVEFELDRLSPLPREEVAYDFLVRERAEKLDVQVLALRRSALAEVLGALEEGGMRPRGVVLTPIALLDLARFAGLDAAPPVVFLVRDGAELELDLVSEGALAATHLLRPAEVSSAETASRLATREARAAGAVAEAPRVFALALGGEEGDGAAAWPPELAETGADLAGRVAERLSIAEEAGGAPRPSLLPAVGVALEAVREGAGSFNLLPEAERRGVEEGAPLVTFLLAALLVLVTFVWLGSALIKDHATAARLHAELERLTPRIREVHREEEEARQLREKLAVLTRGERHRAVVFLNELSSLIPSDAYLTTFRVRSDRVELEGFAASASDLIPLLERSRYFRNVRFTSPVTKVQNRQERFSLTAEIAP